MAYESNAGINLSRALGGPAALPMERSNSRLRYLEVAKYKQALKINVR